MQLNLKFRTCFITFILLISSLSLFVISPDNVRAEGDGIDDILLELYGTHPYITAGWYEYNGTEPLHIEGDITFNLYYTSTLATQGRYKDDLKVTLYSWNPESLIPIPREIKNGNTQITLNPEIFGGMVQNCTVKVPNTSTFCLGNKIFP